MVDQGRGLSNMDARFEAVVWWLNQEATTGSKISMDKVADGLKDYREIHATADGKKPATGAVSRAALYRDFGTVEKLMDRTLKYLQDHDRTVPFALSTFLATGRKSRKSHKIAEKKNGTFNGDVSLGDLERAVAQARADHDDDQLVVLLERLSAQYLKGPVSSVDIESYLGKAFQAARQGYEVGKESSKRGRRKRMLEEQMLCARSAAWAMIQMSRRKIESDQAEADICLSRAVTWKRNEEELAIALKLPLTATVARFHADRGLAVLDDDLEQSVVVLRDISTYLLECKGKGAELNDKVRYHDLTSIIQRMCVVSGAAREHEQLSDLVDKHFPAPMGIDAVIARLENLYSDEGRGSEARRDISALRDVRDMYDALQKAYKDAEAQVDGQEDVAAGEPDPERLRDIILNKNIKPLTFMRISEFEALHALTFARFAIAAHDIETRTKDRVEGFPASEELLTTASNLCYRAQCRTRDKAVGKVVLELLKRVHQSIPLSRETRRRINASRREQANRPKRTDSDRSNPNPIVIALLREVDTMLWKTMTIDPLDFKEANALARIARDIDRYLSGSRRIPQDKGIKLDPA